MELLDQFLKIPILDWDYASFVKRLRRQSGKDFITEDELHRWVDRWFESVITGGQVEVEYVNHLPGILVGPLTLRQAERLIDDYCEATGIAERFRKDDSVLKQFREACLSHLQEHSPEQSGQYLTGGRKVSVHTDAMGHQGNPILVSEALSLYLADAQVRPGTERDWRTAVNRLIEYLGRDSLITSISPTQIVGFRDAIATYPKAVPKELKTASFMERCEYGKATDIRQISARTVNKNLNAIGAVFGWLTRNRYLVENPVQGIKAMVRESTKTERLPFTTEDIILIFGKAYPEPSTAADYWLPFLALYTGCRIEELAKLRVEDVQGIDDISFLHIHGKIKNKASLRRVPLNRHLVQLRFLEHIRGRSHPKALLFDGLQLKRDRPEAANLALIGSTSIRGAEPQLSLLHHQSLEFQTYGICRYLLSYKGRRPIFSVCSQRVWRYRRGLLPL